MTNPEPRTVTLEQINAEIASEHYFTAAEGQAGVVGLSRAEARNIPAALDSLTFCVLVLKNGHKVFGANHGAFDPTVHNPEMGRVMARTQAVDKAGELLAFRLRDQIAAEKGTALPAKRYAAADIAKLERRALSPFAYGYELSARMKDGKCVTATLVDFVVDHHRDLQSLVVERVLAVANGEAP